MKKGEYKKNKFNTQNLNSTFVYTPSKILQGLFWILLLTPVWIIGACAHGPGTKGSDLSLSSTEGTGEVTNRDGEDHDPHWNSKIRESEGESSSPETNSPCGSDSKDHRILFRAPGSPPLPLSPKYPTCSFSYFFLHQEKGGDASEEEDLEAELDEWLEKTHSQPEKALHWIQQAINEMSQHHLLTQARREIWFSLLIKYYGLSKPGTLEREKITSILMNALVLSPHLAKDFSWDLQATGLGKLDGDSRQLNHHRTTIQQTQQLERDIISFHQALLKNPNLQDALFFINGEVLKTLRMEDRLSKMQDVPQQWALISNVYHPLIYYGKWTDFARDWHKKLSPFVKGDCKIPRWNQVKFAWIQRGSVLFPKNCLYTEVASAAGSINNTDNKNNLLSSPEGGVPENQEKIPPSHLSTLEAMARSANNANNNSHNPLMDGPTTDNSIGPLLTSGVAEGNGGPAPNSLSLSSLPSFVWVGLGLLAGWGIYSITKGKVLVIQKKW